MLNLSVGLTCAAILLAVGEASFGHSPPSAQEDQVIRERLGLSGYTIVEVRVRSDDAIAERVHATFDVGDRSVNLTLDPHSLRASGFSVVIDGQATPPPRVRTFRGIDSASRDDVAATVIEGQITAAMRGTQEPLFIQPLTDVIAEANATQHIVYASSQVVDGGWRCADDQHECEGCTGPISTGFTDRGDPIDAACIRTVEVLFDADYPYFQARSSSITTATTDIETVANQVDLIYRRDLGVAVAIKQITLRTSADTDPYASLPLTSVVPGTILSQLGSVWSGVATPTRDLVHLMTGRDLQSSTIGIAYVGVVCRSASNNTGVSQTLFTSNLAMRTILTAHEMGHNFGSSHDTSGSFIMASGVGPSTQQLFSPASISTITTYLSSNSACLTAAGPTAAIDSAQTRAPAPVLIDVLANDQAGCAGTLSLSLTTSSTSQGGTIAVSTGTGPGGRDQVRYTPRPSVPASGLTDSFSYRLTESGNAVVATGAVSVSVQPATSAPCVADFNHSGAASVQDIFDFLSAYFGGNSAADVNASGTISVQDVFDFLAAYFRGCP